MLPTKFYLLPYLDPTRFGLQPDEMKGLSFSLNVLTLEELLYIGCFLKMFVYVF